VVAYQEIEQEGKEEHTHLPDRVVPAIQVKISGMEEGHLHQKVMVKRDALAVFAYSDNRLEVADKSVLVGLTPLLAA